MAPSEREVAQRAIADPRKDLILRLDLEAALERLTARQRQAIQLVMEGYTECEIAEEMGVSQPAVFKLVAKARFALRKDFWERG